MWELVYLALPMGIAHGWGVCGRYITRELARLTPVRLITDRLEAERGARAARDMTRFTWADTAQRFFELLQPR